MAPAKVICVIPLYINHASLYPIVGRFFDDLSEHYPNLQLVVVDDASPLAHDYPVTLQHETNQGFTATVNTGLAYAFGKLRADIVIIANDDLQIASGDLGRFFGLDPKAAIIASPMDTSASSTDRFGAIWSLTQAAYAKLGPLDPRYKHFMSDLDYYLKAKEAGVMVEKWYDVTIAHPESATYKHENKAQLLAQDQETYARTRRDPGTSPLEHPTNPEL